MPRRTLARDATVEGVGLHTGARVTARCLGAEPGRGIVFRRVDLPGAPEPVSYPSGTVSGPRSACRQPVPGPSTVPFAPTVNVAAVAPSRSGT